MNSDATNLLEIVGLACKHAELFVETTTVISKNVANLDKDNTIKAFANILKVQAVAIESQLAVLRKVLADAQSNANESKVVEDAVKSTLPLEDYTLQTDMQLGAVEQARKKVPTILPKAEGAVSQETGGAVANKQEEIQPLTAEAQKQRFTDSRRKEVEAATFPKATDRIVFTRALSYMDSHDTASREDAAKTLAGIDHELAVRTLAEHMGHEPSEQVRQECIRSLTTLGTKEDVAITAITNALTDKSARVRLIAVWSLYRLAGAESVPALIDMLSDKNEGVRRRAATCIGWLAREQKTVGMIGSNDSRRMASALVKCLQDTERSVRIAALGTLELVTGRKMSEQSTTDDKDSHHDIIEQWKKWWQQELLR